VEEMEVDEVEEVEVEVETAFNSSAANILWGSLNVLCTFISLLLQGPSLPLLVP
jgi:hypothetical protein